MLRTRLVLLALAGAALATPLQAASLTDSLKRGTPELKSAGALAFGLEGILFIGDPQAAAIVALDTEDRTPATSKDRPRVENLDEKAASLLGIESKQLRINALAVNPISGNTYLSLARGSGPDAAPVLLRVDRSGKLADVPLKDVKFARTTLPNAAEGKSRQDVITHLAYVDGRVIVAGLSNEEFASKLRSIPFPFTEANAGASVEIYHGSHGKVETRSPIRTFVPYQVKGESEILAAYTCTPLVRFPAAELKPGAKVKGKTIAELGNGNRPLDMIVYKKDGKDYILMANSRRGVMKIPTDGIDKVDAITSRVKDKAGLQYETVAGLQGVEHLDRYDNGHTIILVRTKDKGLTLETIELP
jgi:hypothetical protein